MTRMKESGIDWIGQIPEEWQISKIKFTTQLNGRIGWQGLTSAEYKEEGPYLITGTDFQNGTINFETAVHIDEKRWSEASQIQVENGDLLITKDGTVGKVAIISGLDDKASLNSGVLRIQTVDEIDRKFLYYVLLSDEFWMWFNYTNSGASTILHLYQNVFDEFTFTFPQKNEQQKIADFLDKKTAQLDKVKALLEEQIQKLKDYRASLIYETVTKGLDKNVPMKDSGIDWIGQVPQGWGVKPIKHVVATPVTDGPHETPLLCETGIPFLSAEAVKNGVLDFNYKRGYISLQDHERFKKKISPKKDDIFIVKSGATTGNVGIVNTDEIFDIWSPLALIRCKKSLAVQKYIYYYLISNIFKAQVEFNWSFGTQQNIGMGIIENIKLILPPLSEQTKISDLLDKKIYQIDQLIQIKNKQIDNINKQRQTLIYDYVTGKRRV
ncbi:restriction endonuclease subunit S [Streptococcus sp. SR1]|uniref:restriction endonuclease subunit S n=1 Tax=Streptococcus sp. SR1 TaxID=1161416 RepID=UPI0004473493|nr:restriction endonuclease subunit S [Streptococcus sp. SR1]EUC80706.1 type I restriction modification DNA specificity domain protein [Streptococcus sp. SR1]